MNTKYLPLRLIVVAVVSLMLLTGTTTVNERVHGQSDVTDQLTPTLDSEIIFPEVTLTSHGTGGDTLKHYNTLDSGESLAYDLYIDRQELTYTALYYEDDGDAGYQVEDYNEEENDTMQNPSHPVYSAWTKQITEDPVQYDLAKTESRLHWWTESSLAHYKWRRGFCTSYKTPVGTIWFIGYCTYTGPGAPASSIQYVVNGGYYNDNWGFPNWRTVSRHWQRITANHDGTAKFEHHHFREGEDYWLLHDEIHTEVKCIENCP